MKEYVPTYPNPDDDKRPEWEKKLRPLLSAAEDLDGEGARPSSLIPYYHHKPDRAYLLQLKYAVEIANEETVRKYGPLPPGDLPVQKKTKPKVPYRDFQGNLVSEVPIIEESDDMKLKQTIAAAALMVGTAACNSATPLAESANTSNTTKAASDSVTLFEQIEARKKKTASPLQSLLNVFASPSAGAWSAFNAIPGLHWHDAKPLDNPNATSPEMSRYRSGSLLLTGFSEVNVPDGKVGAEAGVRKDNEGNVGVTLNGDVNTVKSIALMKFYPSKNYQEILQNQLNGGDTIKLIAGTCELDYGTTATNTQVNTFYKIKMGAKAFSVFVEAYVDEDVGNQGPGYTYFVFYRDKPQQRLEAMRCKEQ